MKKILVIEDNFDIRENISEILELDGYEVLSAENGRIGVEMAQNQKPDMVICDIMMPELDGYGVLHMLSKNPETADIPFIFLTAKADRGDFRKGMEMGADDYITKPFNDLELLNAIESRFKKAKVFENKYSNNLVGLDSFLRDLGGDQELKKLVENRKMRSYKKKSDIYREGDFPLYLFYVESGKVKTYKTNTDGKELIVNIFSEGQFFGYVNLLGEQSYTESATAMESTDISLIPKDDFFNLIFQNRQVSQKFIKMLSANIEENENQLIKLAYNSVRKRIAEALLKFFEHKTEDQKAIKVSREDLSNLAGTSIETAIRTLSDFKDEKLIEISSGKIKILQKSRLQNLNN